MRKFMRGPGVSAGRSASAGAALARENGSQFLFSPGGGDRGAFAELRGALRRRGRPLFAPDPPYARDSRGPKSEIAAVSSVLTNVAR